MKYFTEYIKKGPANWGEAFKTQKIGIHSVVLSPKSQSSYLHAESLEEEFIYVVSGHPHLFINGYIYQLEAGMFAGFPPGTGIIHNLINNTEANVELIVIGERTKLENKYLYPLNLEFKPEHQKDWRELDFVKNIKDLSDRGSFSYNGDIEKFTNGIRLSNHVGLKALGIWHEVLRPGFRTSWPHAHSVEEEMAIVLNGECQVWLNGELHDFKMGDAVFFRPGSNVAHTIIGNGIDDCELLVIGESKSIDDKIYYPQHEARNLECNDEGWFWEDRPSVFMGRDSAIAKTDRFEIVEYISAAEFIKVVGDLLYQNEVINSLQLGLVENNIFQEKFFLIKENAKVVASACLNIKNLVISMMPASAITLFCDYLLKNNIKIPGVVGPAHTTETFARIYSQKRQCHFKLAMVQKVYELKEVIFPRGVTGELITGTSEHEDFVFDCLRAFHLESVPHDPWDDTKMREGITNKLKLNHVCLWKDQKNISMCFLSRPTKNTMTITAVFTPPEFRKKGYASALVASVSELILKSGKNTAVLYTDIQNPTSNSIYKKIGYKEVIASRHFMFL
jgi:uncharacterized cupin superfamily protein/predicted GNAT family acetyltransferase